MSFKWETATLAVQQNKLQSKSRLKRGTGLSCAGTDSPLAHTWLPARKAPS